MAVDVDVLPTEAQQAGLLLAAAGRLAAAAAGQLVTAGPQLRQGSSSGGNNGSNGNGSGGNNGSNGNGSGANGSGANGSGGSGANYTSRSTGTHLQASGTTNGNGGTTVHGGGTTVNGNANGGSITGAAPSDARRGALLPAALHRTSLDACELGHACHACCSRADEHRPG
jgi:hypothetical protein